MRRARRVIGRMRWSGRALAASVATAVLATTAGTGTGSVPEVADRVRLVANPCGDVFFLGAMGSGQRPTWDDTGGFGKQVNAVRKQVVKSLPERDVKVSPVAYPAHGTELLMPDAMDVAFGLVHYRKGVKKYFEGMARGVDVAYHRLVRRDSRCPREKIVLAGYSQGAMVMHRVLERIDRRQPSVADRIAGVVLIADGDRVPHSYSRILGAPAAPRAGQGISSVLANRPDVPARFNPYTYQFCTYRDIVCDFRGWHLRSLGNASTGIRIHGGYLGPRYAPTVAPKIAKVVMGWPLPDPRTQTVQLAVGEPVDQRLAVSVRPDFRDRLTWEPTTGLPEGLTLSADGYLRGTPTGHGPDTTSYRVRSATRGFYRAPAEGTVAWAYDGEPVPEPVPVSGNAPEWIGDLTVVSAFDGTYWRPKVTGSFRDTNAEGTVGFMFAVEWPAHLDLNPPWAVQTFSPWANINATANGDEFYDAKFGSGQHTNADNRFCIALVDVWDDWGGAHSPFSESRCFTADGRLIAPVAVDWEAVYAKVADKA